MWKLLVKSSNIPIYVNKRKIVSCNLTFGDEIFILGLKIIWLNNSVRINTIKDLITINGLAETNLPKEDNSMYTKITAKEKRVVYIKKMNTFFILQI